MPAPSIPSPVYIGRFAPSPTGQLHQGSLLTAVASYLDAHSHKGIWLVRMEDLDPPREQAGAADAILAALEAHNLLWDGSVMYQSQRQTSYRAALTQLQSQNLAFACDCSRQRLKKTLIYDGRCRHTPPNTTPAAIRIKVPDAGSPAWTFEDLLLGHQQQDLAAELGDFVILRKDKLFAYQLAVVVDDIAQGITHIIRGCDLLDSSVRQLYLLNLLGGHPPKLGHLPTIVNRDGKKLSKQTHAPPLNNRLASANLFQALTTLGLRPPPDLRHAPCHEQLSWGIAHWQRSKVPTCRQLSIDSVGNLPTS